MKISKGNKIAFMLIILRVLMKACFAVLKVAVAFASDERKPRYTAIHAHELHEEGLISDEEFMRSLRGKK